eukprot:GEMP01062248.1.p1 GENE.GEMP01062248.1~~GEMP01062248.1.p1  ORF type:complete len:152 (-),score=32.14 GEMP01062248.1:611-1066(-)
MHRVKKPLFFSGGLLGCVGAANTKANARLLLADCGAGARTKGDARGTAKSGHNCLVSPHVRVRSEPSERTGDLQGSAMKFERRAHVICDRTILMATAKGQSTQASRTKLASAPLANAAAAWSSDGDAARSSTCNSSMSNGRSHLVYGSPPT